MLFWCDVNVLFLLLCLFEKAEKETFITKKMMPQLLIKYFFSCFSSSTSRFSVFCMHSTRLYIYDCWLWIKKYFFAFKSIQWIIINHAILIRFLFSSGHMLHESSSILYYTAKIKNLSLKYATIFHTRVCVCVHPT